MGFPSPARRLAPWLFVLPLLALGCDRGQSPTEPTGSSKIAAASSATGNGVAGDAIDKARGGNGGGNGQGHGGGGNGGGNGHGGALTLQIDPSTWNTNWVNANGNVQAFVRGGDASKIDLGSIALASGGKTLS